MEGGFPYGDIIVIAAIAAFILLRYRSMLGEQRGRDVSDIVRSRPMEPIEPVVQPVESRRKEKPVVVEPVGPFADKLSAMRAIDADFTTEEFLEGARGAYEMVIDAYNESDHETLKMLLSDAVYKEFKAVADANEKEGRKPHTTLVAIVKAEIADAKLKGNVATITVDFLSEQIPLVRNAAGEVIEGNASHQEAVEDQWVFERNLTSADPAWKIMDT